MAVKKGFFQKADQKKQYSEKVLHNVEDAYRPKNKRRAQNPISSNTMSGEDPDAHNFQQEALGAKQDLSAQSRFKKAVNYAFAGPQAKQKKQVETKSQSVAQEKEDAATAQVFAPPASVRAQQEQSGKEQYQKEKAAKKKTEEPKKRNATKKSIKLSKPEIHVRTGHIEVQPELAIESKPVSDVFEAMQALEADVQETRGNYEPIQESEIQSARKLGLKSLFSQKSLPQTELIPLDRQYQLEFDEISSAEFHCSTGDLGLSFEPQDYRHDAKKTQMLNLPSQGIKRSNRGTIEAVYQPNGNVVQAQYNRCGILIEVSVAGAMRLTRSAETGRWSISYADGTPTVNSVANVAFDRLGNLCFSTDDGQTTMICADGRVIERA